PPTPLPSRKPGHDISGYRLPCGPAGCDRGSRRGTAWAGPPRCPANPAQSGQEPSRGQGQPCAIKADLRLTGGLSHANRTRSQSAGIRGDVKDTAVTLRGHLGGPTVRGIIVAGAWGGPASGGSARPRRDAMTTTTSAFTAIAVAEP